MVTARVAAASVVVVLAACAPSAATPAAAVATSATAPAAAGAAACTFTNPIRPGADPWIVRHGGYYYMSQSRRNAIWVFRSTSLTRPARDSARVWTAPDTGWNRTNVWAPELHRIDGRWYVYYTAGRAGPPFLHQRSGVLESVGDDPLGRFAERGMLYTGDSVATGAQPRWAIDLTVARIGGRLYAYWSGWTGDATTDRTPQHLYVARMTNPWTIATNRVRISSPTEPWEQRSGPDGLALQEGPELLERDGRRFVVYSTGESWLPTYKLGMLRMTGPDADPLDAASYVKTGPVFQGANGVFGVGHHTVTTSPDGREDWLVYHAKATTTPGWGDRQIRMQPFTWKADGSPDFGAPVPSGRPLPVPSGECG